MTRFVLRGGLVVDGSGRPAYRGDVAVAGGVITAVGDVARDVGPSIDARGLVVAPGFIDMHSHSDVEVLTDGGYESRLGQGITLEVLGQDGLSFAPTDDAALQVLKVQLRGWHDTARDVGWDWRSVDDYLSRIDRGAAVNAAYLVPHGTVRLMVVGADDRPATPAEIETMCGVVAQGLDEGAVGLSAGLSYAPAMFAEDDELVALCSVTAARGGFYCPHHRCYGQHALEAYASCVDIARRSGVALHLAHCLLPYSVNAGRAPDLVRLLDAASARGVDLSFDLYPYTAGSTYLHSFLPGWFSAGGPDQTLARLASPELRPQLRLEVEQVGTDGFHHVPVDWQAIVISGTAREANERHVGLSVAQAAARDGKDPLTFACELLVDERLATMCVIHVGNEENNRHLMRHPAATFGTDGILVGQRPHPRGWGCFPRVLGRYVRELSVLSLEEAVRKMTAAPARRLRLDRRGQVRPGYAADLVCFDPAAVQDTASYEVPRAKPLGVAHVFVNGVHAVDGGSVTGRRGGRAIRRSGSRS